MNTEEKKMYNFDNCRVFYDCCKKARDIVLISTIVSIDYTYNALYWIERLNMELFATATDKDGNKYKVYRNVNRNLITAIPENK